MTCVVDKHGYILDIAPIIDVDHFKEIEEAIEECYP